MEICLKDFESNIVRNVIEPHWVIIDKEEE